jgi:D-serine deaminase-like pyridoxal phosphate-dependent protein
MPAFQMPVELGAIEELRLNLFDGQFMLPTMVLKRTALEHNISLLADYCARFGVSLAPHGKTTMAPEIFRRQLDAGAWAISVATPWQARVAASVGVPRILIANEVVDEAGLRWLASAVREGRAELLCYVDSRAGVQLLDRAMLGWERRLPVLVEIGVPGGRTGARTASAALDVATAVAESQSLQLAGCAFFEGIVDGPTDLARFIAVRDVIATVRETVSAIEHAHLWGDVGEIVVTGGGSQYIDIVVEELARPWETSVPVRPVVRSGCYVTHDDVGLDAVSPFGSHAAPGTPRLRAALEVWAVVLSTPEPGRAVIGAGRRDLPFDGPLPVVTKVRRRGEVTEIGRSITVTRLNDQHAYLSLDAGTELGVADQVALGIAHPCSAFDRWRFVPVVEDDYRVSEVLELIF